MKVIGQAVANHLENENCLPECEGQLETNGGWRVKIRAYIDAHRIPDYETIRSLPAGIFDLKGRDRSSKQSTTIYAVIGEKTAFSSENRCRASELPRTTLILISGRESNKPWYIAEDVTHIDLQGASSVRDVIGEVCKGVTFVMFLNCEVWEIDSAAPISTIAKAAEVQSVSESMAAQQELRKHRLDP